MAFKSNVRIWALLSVLVLNSCADIKTGAAGRFKIGTEISQSNPDALELTDEDGLSSFYIYDAYSQRINFVDTKTQSIHFSPKMSPSATGRFWLASQANSYFFDIQEGNVALTRPDGQANQKVMKLAGKIISYAADFNEGYFAFVDEYFSIGLVKITVAGEVEATWTGGSLIDKKLNVVAGEMIPGGTLLLVTDDNQVLKINLAASLEKSAWSYDLLSPDLKHPSWIGSVEASSSRAMILDEDSLDLIDLSTGAIIATRTLSKGTNLKLSKKGRDHVFYFDALSQKYNLVYPNADELTSIPIRLIEDQIKSSYLGTENLMILTTASKALQLKVNDNEALVKVAKDVPADARVGLSDNHVVAMYESPLGLIELFDLRTEEATRFEAFNFDVLRQ